MNQQTGLPNQSDVDFVSDDRILVWQAKPEKQREREVELVYRSWISDMKYYGAKAAACCLLNTAWGVLGYLAVWGDGE